MGENWQDQIGEKLQRLSRGNDVISRSMYKCERISLEQIKSNLGIIKSFIMLKMNFVFCCMVLDRIIMQRKI